MTLQVAASQGVEALVLGAWGCGVFRNDPKDIAGMFRDALCSVHLPLGVVFAVPSARDKRRCPLAAFREVFRGIAIPMAEFAGNKMPKLQSSHKSGQKKQPNKNADGESFASRPIRNVGGGSVPTRVPLSIGASAPKPVRKAGAGDSRDAALQQFAVKGDGDIIELVDIGGQWCFVRELGFSLSYLLFAFLCVPCFLRIHICDYVAGTPD